MKKNKFLFYSFKIIINFLYWWLFYLNYSFFNHLNLEINKVIKLIIYLSSNKLIIYSYLKWIVKMKVIQKMKKEIQNK